MGTERWEHFAHEADMGRKREVTELFDEPTRLCLDAGFNEHFTKPMNFQVLRNAVERFTPHTLRAT
jgi:hypothetical protein